MPTYEYICDACSHEFEKFHSITAEPIKVCPVCRKRKVRRKISSGAGILFKGGGFYETDYRSAGYTESAKKEADAAKPASEGKSETKSDTKSDSTKPETKSAEPAPKAAEPAPKAEPKQAKSSSKKR